jgi:protein MpaA
MTPAPFKKLLYKNLICLFSLCLVYAGGCMQVQPHEQTLRESLLLGYSVESRPIYGEILGEGDDVILILATIHGNERAGTPLVEKMSEHLSSHPQILLNRCVVLMPLANPDGEAKNTRFNYNGVDLNRNFDTANRINNSRNGPTPLSEPESQIIKAVIEQWNPARIVSIHQPLNCIDYDGFAQPLAEHMAPYGPLPLKKIGALPGSLGSYATEQNIPIITLELPRQADELDVESLWNTYGQYLLAAITYPEPLMSHKSFTGIVQHIINHRRLDHNSLVTGFAITVSTSPAAR